MVAYADHTQPVLQVAVQAGNLNFELEHSQDVYLSIARVPLGNLRDQIGEFATTCLTSIVNLTVSPSLPLQLPVDLEFLVSPPATEVGVVGSFSPSLL